MSDPSWTASLLCYCVGFLLCACGARGSLPLVAAGAPVLDALFVFRDVVLSWDRFLGDVACCVRVVLRQTSIMAVAFDGGVVLGADSRTTTGTYIANRVSDKITPMTSSIFCCRSGSAADTQAISDYVRYVPD